jgi:hypothetical protein
MGYIIVNKIGEVFAHNCECFVPPDINDRTDPEDTYSLTFCTMDELRKYLPLAKEQVNEDEVFITHIKCEIDWLMVEGSYHRIQWEICEKMIRDMITPTIISPDYDDTTIELED